MDAVHINLESIELTASGGVTGQIWVELGGLAFPEKGWFDFPVTVLTWWIAALREFESGREKETVLLFMDGPEQIVISRHDGGHVYARRLHAGEPIGPPVVVDVTQLLHSALDEAPGLVQAARARRASESYLRLLAQQLS